MPKVAAEPSSSELQELLHHANVNSAAMQARAEEAQAERDYWQARCSLAEEVVKVSRTVALDPGLSGAGVDALRAAGGEFEQRRLALNRQTASEREQRRRERGL